MSANQTACYGIHRPLAIDKNTPVLEDFWSGRQDRIGIAGSDFGKSDDGLPRTQHSFSVDITRLG